MGVGGNRGVIGPSGPCVDEAKGSGVEETLVNVSMRELAMNIFQGKTTEDGQFATFALGTYSTQILVGLANTKKKELFLKEEQMYTVTRKIAHLCQKIKNYFLIKKALTDENLLDMALVQRGLSKKVSMNKKTSEGNKLRAGYSSPSFFKSIKGKSTEEVQETPIPAKRHLEYHRFGRSYDEHTAFRRERKKARQALQAPFILKKESTEFSKILSRRLSALAKSQLLPLQLNFFEDLLQQFVDECIADQTEVTAAKLKESLFKKIAQGNEHHDEILAEDWEKELSATAKRMLPKQVSDLTQERDEGLWEPGTTRAVTWYVFSELDKAKRVCELLSKDNELMAAIQREVSQWRG